MALEIIKGRAGVGKTKLCTDLLLKEVSEGRGREVIFLLYNNHQVQSVREFLRRKLDAYIEPLLITFHGLIREVLFRGLASPPHIVPENVAFHLFHKAVEESDLSYYRGLMSQGLFRLLKSTVDELKAYNVSPDSLQDSARRLSGRKGSSATLTKKINEVSAIYRRYQQLLKRHEYEEWPDAAQRALKLLHENPGLLREKKLLIMDGFFYLTPWQKGILSALVSSMPRSVATVCCSEEKREAFRVVEEMCAFLKGFPEHRVVNLDENRRTKALALRHIERHLFEHHHPLLPADESLSIHEAESREGEAELIARTIKRMVIEDGHEYTDFGILLRNDSIYKDIFKQVFNRFEIPLHMSDFAYLKDIPGFRAVITLIQIFSEGWNREKVIAFMRDVGTAREDSGISPFSSHLIDYIESRAIAKGISDRETWLKFFRSASDGDTIKNQAAEAIQALYRYEEKLNGAETTREFIDSLSEILNKLGLLENSFVDEIQCADYRDFKYRDRAKDVRVEAAAIVKLYELLSQFLSLSGDDETDGFEPAELLEFIICGGETLTVEGSTEAQAGVWISNIFESRAPEFKVVFAPGMLEGLFPPGLREDPIFQERERRLLNRTGQAPLPEKAADADRERYLFYIVLTRASEKVVLSYPGLDSSGRESLPSFYIDELKRLFTPESLRGRFFKKDFSRILPLSDEILSEDELAQCAARGLIDVKEKDDAEKKAEILSLYNLAIDRGLKSLKRIPAPNKTSGKLLLDSVEVLAGKLKEKPYSVSAVHTYGLCKFKYFCRYLLGLQPRKEFKIDFADEGDIFHEALRRIHLCLTGETDTQELEDSRDFAEAGLQTLETVMQENYGRHLLSTRAANLKERMKIDFTRFLEKEYAYQAGGTSRPAFLELSFGGGPPEQPSDPESTMHPLKLKNERGTEALIRGRIDRVDLVQSGDRFLGLILDYKRGATNISLKKMAEEDIRLPLYMLALKRLFGIEPASAFYYSIRESRKRGVCLSEIHGRLGGKEWGLSDNDSVSREQISDLIIATEEEALKRTEAIRYGEITVRPLNSLECTRCDYNPVCRYDPRTHSSRQAQ